jgi:hypothetical protein
LGEEVTTTGSPVPNANEFDMEMIGRVRRFRLAFRRPSGRAALSAMNAVVLWLATGCATPPDPEAEVAELLGLHERVLEAHRTGDVEGWMAVEGNEYVSANGGEVTFPSAAERRAVREPYLRSTTFTVYRDLRPPVVRLSADATLGWVIAEVEIRGTQLSNGVETPVEATWAWIELYEKQSGMWRLVGNVSNRRP